MNDALVLAVATLGYGHMDTYLYASNQERRARILKAIEAAKNEPRATD